MRLHFVQPAPGGWQPGWNPVGPVRRCGCGARIVSACSRFSTCERGCVHLAPPPPPPVPTRPRPPARERANFAKLIVGLRVLEHGFVRDQRRGRPPSSTSLGLAFEAVARLWELCPGHGEEILAALPWLSRQAGKGRAA